MNGPTDNVKVSDGLPVRWSAWLCEAIMCNCKICKRDQKFICIASKLGARDKAWMLKTLTDFENSEEERDYNACILDGSWPSAVEQLRCALAKAMKIRKKKGEPLIKEPSIFRRVSDSEIMLPGR